MSLLKYFNEKELDRAFVLWYREYNFKDIEAQLKPFLDFEIRQNKAWLRQIRMSSFLTTEAVAKKAKISRSSYTQFEESEIAGKITIENMQKAAEAMDCELVYAIRPKSRIPFSHQIFAKLVKAVETHPWLRKCDQRRRAGALSYLVKEKMRDPQFKREQNWSRSCNKEDKELWRMLAAVDKEINLEFEF